MGPRTSRITATYSMMGMFVSMVIFVCGVYGLFGGLSREESMLEPHVEGVEVSTLVGVSVTVLRAEVGPSFEAD